MDVNISEVMFEVFTIAIKAGGPVLLLSMAIGVVISIIQAATQIHEQTLTFVPKLLVIGIVLMSSGGNLMEMLADFTRKIFAMIAA